MYAYLIYQLCIKVPQKSSSVLGIQLSKEKLMVGLAFSSKTPWSVSEALRASSDYNKPQRHHQRVGRSCKTRWGPWLKRPTRRCWRCRGLSEGPALCFNLLVSGLSDSSALRWLHFKSLSYNMCFLISCLWLFTLCHSCSSPYIFSLWWQEFSVLPGLVCEYFLVASWLHSRLPTLHTFISLWYASTLLQQPDMLILTALTPKTYPSLSSNLEIPKLKITLS